jgi:hypothetical protein
MVNKYNPQSYSPGKKTQRNYLLFGQNKNNALPKTQKYVSVTDICPYTVANAERKTRGRVAWPVRASLIVRNVREATHLNSKTEVARELARNFPSGDVPIQFSAV